MAYKQRRFKFLTILCGWISPVVVIGMLVTLAIAFAPAWEVMGTAFFTTWEWDPVRRDYGVLVFIAGTFISTAVALVISVPCSFFIAILTSEILKSKTLAKIISSLIEIIAAIPSVVLGLWGIFTIVPIMQAIQRFYGFIPYGTGLLSACIVLAFMIVPFAASLSREVISLVPQEIKEGAYSLGATRAEVILGIMVPYAKSGILGGILLSAGRALGETMAVTMLIGNSNHFIENIFSPTNTMASIIANEFAEADDPVYYSALMGVGLALLISTVSFSLAGRYILKKTMIRKSKKT